VKRLILSVVALGLAGPAWAGDSGEEPSGQVSFDMPSRNMCCTYTPSGGTATYKTSDNLDELSCLRVAPQYWIVTLSGSGNMTIDKHPGEVPGCGNETVLAYGQRWNKGPFICVARKEGLDCSAGRTGFLLSRSGVKVKK
jgi:hypothetical protein